MPAALSLRILMNSQTNHRFFVACSPGLEPLLAEELEELGVLGSARPGGVEARGDIRSIWTSCYKSRLAESVRVRLKAFSATSFEALEAGLERLPWHAYLPRNSPVQVSVTCHRSRLWHSDAVRERALEVLARRRGAQPARVTQGDDADSDGALEPSPHCARVYVRIERDEVQVSIDASGDRLHRRGYRTHVAEASLRETLAAALVHVALRHAPDSTHLWDPFCGAGTIALEWLERASGRAAGTRRTFAFERWPTHDGAAYALFREQQPSQKATLCEAWGSDVSERALAAARNNAERAGFAEHTRWLHGDFAAAAEQVPEGALVISNPPYGVRVEEGGSLARFERLLVARRDLRPVVLLLGGAARLRNARLPFSAIAKTKNGGLSVRVELLTAKSRARP